MAANFERLKKYEIPGRVAVVPGNGGLAKIVVTAGASTAEIYAQGAQVTHFQKPGEPPLLFVSRKSGFAPGQSIRGGVPICFPWFGNREGGPSHGYARTSEWELVKSAAPPGGSVTVQFALPPIPGREAWKNLRTEFSVTVGNTLTMELATANDACDGTLEFEACLHTYLHVGDIGAVSLTGLQGAPFDDFAFGANGARRSADSSPLRITEETNRVYPHHTGVVEVHDAAWKRVLRVEKFNSQSTVVWNPWTTQKLPDDFDPAEHKQMICVESGNVKQDKVLLGPGKMAALKVILSSRKF